MKRNLSKICNISISKTQFYISLSVVVLTFVGINLFENIVDPVFAQADTTNSSSNITNNNSNTTLARDQQQETSSLHPQLVLIIEEEGKIINQRVLGVHPHPVIESTFVSNQTIFGDIQARNLGTYWSTLYTNGTVHGEGHGISTTTDGEMVTWTAEGIGNANPAGDVRFEGSLFFNTSSEGELSNLNNKVAFFDYEVDSEGNTSDSVWEIR
ncbi:MAG TPA: hypothetical protein VJP58_10565 [Candidatus Nitrosocosmicus sp.]|nr:hypothetical protein [Candidatus Nitrosocosmicus sp.]